MAGACSVAMIISQIIFSCHQSNSEYSENFPSYGKIVGKQSSCFSHVTPGCFTLQAESELEVLRRQSQVLLETAATNTQLNEALGQIEELQHELGREKEKRASKEEELHAELQQLQESTLLEENQSE